MKARQLIMIAVVGLAVIGGMVALGAASPTDQATAEAMDAGDENAPAVDRGDAGAAADRSANADSVGPSDRLPAHVPGHVSDIQDRIGSFLDGSIDHLGQSLGELLGNDADDATDGDQTTDKFIDEGVGGNTPSTT